MTIQILNKQENQEQEKEQEKIDPYLEIGNTGLEQYSGRINEEYLRSLKGSKGAKIYREMRDNSAIIGAILFAIDMLIRSVEWRCDPESEEPQDTEAAEFIETCMHDMSHTWTDFISEILSMLSFGWSFHETVYKMRRGPEQEDPSYRSNYDDGKIGWRKMPIRSQETLDRWLFDDNLGLQGMVQKVTGKEYRIPIEKGLLFRTTKHKANPEGRSVLRNAYRSWYFVKRIEEIEGIGIERDLAGLPVAYVPNKIMRRDAAPTDAAIYATIKDIVRNIRRDEQEGVVWPGDRDENGNLLYELKLLTTGGTRQFDTDKIISRYDQRIAMTVLADFILLGHEKVGSFALSSDKTELFSTALEAWLCEIKEVINRYAVERLLQLNGMQGKCSINHGDIEVPELGKLADYISKLAGSGAIQTGDIGLENTLRSYAGLPERIDDDDFYTDDDETNGRTNNPGDEDTTIMNPKDMEEHDEQ